MPESYLSKVEYALLGLGDTNYTTFLGFPKSVERQLAKLGAKQFYKSGWADDAVGLEIVVDPWIEGLLLELINQLKEPHKNFISVSNTVPESVQPPAKVQSTPSKVVPEKTDATIVKEELDVEKCLDGLASLTVSVAPLRESNLKIPVIPQPFLYLTFHSDSKVSYYKLSLKSIYL